MRKNGEALYSGKVKVLVVELQNVGISTESETSAGCESHLGEVPEVSRQGEIQLL